MYGSYRDQVVNKAGQVLSDTYWQSNTIVDHAWPLLAGLLKNDPALEGILYWAVGAGDPLWDTARATPSPSAAHLHLESARQAVDPDNIAYLNPDTSVSLSPTACIEVSAVFNWPDDRLLREFGLFGGDASEAADSGLLINCVIHPRINLEGGTDLTRRVRFTLKPDIGPDWLRLPAHWLGRQDVQQIDGVGQAYARTLRSIGVRTIRELAQVEPALVRERFPLMRAVELRAKARMALRTADGIRPIAGLNNRSLWDILTTPLDTLVADTGAAAEQISRLIEQAGALQLTLDNEYIRQITIGQLAQAN